MADVREGNGELKLWSFFWWEAWLGLVEVEMFVSVELQRCLNVMEFLLQAVLVTGAESTADQCVVDSRLKAWMME